MKTKNVNHGSLLDVVVIGTGFGACPPAVELAKKGREVVMIERGRRWKPEEFIPHQDAKLYSSRIEQVTSSHAGLQAPRIVGGGSVVYSCTSFRAPTEAFEHVNQRTGRQFWPKSFTRKIFDPFYEKAERKLGVIQFDWQGMPKKGVVFARFLQKGGLKVDLAPAAMSNNCMQFGFCRYGCPNSSKNDLTTNYIPEAESFGAKVWEESTVEGLVPHPQGYQVTVASRGERKTYLAKVVILGAGTWGTANLLMKNRSSFPRLSGELGRNFHANGNLLFGFQLAKDEWDTDMFKGRENPGVYSFSHWREKKITLLACTLHPMEIFGAAQVMAPELTDGPRFYGKDHKRWLLDHYRNKILTMETVGLPDATYLDFKMEGGIAKPVSRYDSHYMSYYHRAREISAELAYANQAQLLETKILVGGKPGGDYLTFTNHQMGSCKIGETPEEGVIDESGEVFGYKNLFVTDGAAVPGPLGVNPSLTILATSELLTSRIVSKVA